MGGGDLNMKKSWHPLTWANQEKVWAAQQRAANEKKKLEEVQKILREERQIEDLRRIQREAGLIDKSERLDWMYEGAVKDANSEEFLLGKPVDLKDGAVEQIKQLSSAPGSLMMTSKSPSTLPSTRDQLAKMKDDPLVLIKRQEMAAKQQMLKNPLNQEKLLKQLEAERQKKISKKHKKSEKDGTDDSHKHRKEKVQESDGDDVDRYERGSRDRSRNGESERDTHRDRQSDRRHSNDNRSTRDDVRTSEWKSRDASRQQQHHSRRPQLSEEEKARKLREMEMNAEDHELSRTARLKRYQVDDVKASTETNKRAKFLGEIHQKTYLQSDESVSERLRRTAHTHQSSRDQEGGLARRD
eukprot:c3688_g1_i1.p1 GENE.c3688_g1_i1~~c3688_g1_i1.p1  ORF type:complete len:356 (+),score=88.85 c3688_g1_i1:39-1106(+)